MLKFWSKTTYLDVGSPENASKTRKFTAKGRYVPQVKSESEVIHNKGKAAVDVYELSQQNLLTCVASGKADVTVFLGISDKEAETYSTKLLLLRVHIM